MSDNTHAAMCVYCGETIIYDTREVTDMAAAQAQLIEHDQQCAKNPLVSDLARHKRMFAAACEQLGNIQQALGSTVVGIEPALVRELVEERDALAAHLEQLQEAGDKLREPWDLSTILGAETRRLIERWDKARAESPDTSLARRDSLKQREAVLEMANDLAHEFNDKQLEIIRKRAERLGQQAEGHQ